ncbi:MAG: arylsulfatase [Bacteroidetes bacterium]|nr:arylsulfatase [Bacteroidota bacterium]
MKIFKVTAQAVLFSLALAGCTKKETALPNIVIIYADDMGYGDLNCQNPDSKIPTPNLDQLAAEGMRFTDAHSSSGICSPSRFALLTGMYHWRRQHGIVQAFGKPFFKDSDITLPQLLKERGYTTACIGKWHLGWNWKFKGKPTGPYPARKKKPWYYTVNDIDWNGPVAGGPSDRGFDYYFGDGTINFPPYTWVENDQLLEIPTRDIDLKNIGFETKEGAWEFRRGPSVEGWNPYKALPTLSSKTVEWIGRQKQENPFFLYFALPSPHAPIIPNDEFIGKSNAGGYGDFMFQTDWVIGQVLNALKEKGLEENTIVIFTSDNGPEKYAFARAEKYEHFSMGDFRGLKRDVWEGGHHVPFIIKWPGQVKPASVSNELISQIDVMATLTSITGIELPQGAAPDSYSFLPILNGKSSSPIRTELIHNTNENKWGLRKGDWLYINDKSGEHSKMPETFKKLRGYEDFETEGLLFNIKEDPEQIHNLYEKYPEKVKEMDQGIEEYKAGEG